MHAEETRVDRPLKPLQPESERLDPTALGAWLLQLVPAPKREGESS